jgi:hypothetical protein
MMALAIVVSTLGLSAAHAHESRPAYLELTEIEPGVCDVVWKAPSRQGLVLRLTPHLGGDFVERSVPVSRILSDAIVKSWRVSSPSGAVGGQEVWVEGIEVTMLDVLIRVEFLDGRTFTTLLRPETPRVIIPEKESLAGVAWTYLRLGFEHILGGVDHLLFVFALVLLVSGRMLLFKTITAFTLAHSITLACAVLGLVSVPGAPVEAVISLSILFVACELRHRQQGRTGLAERHPWIVAFAFGLLHGFGFAGALTEIGLPQTDVPLALFQFNLGVELGQIAFVVTVLLAGALLTRIPFRRPTWSVNVPTYAIGSLASFWLIQRIASF